MRTKNGWLWVLSGMLLAMALFAYKNHFNNPFEFDDDHTIVSNYYIRDIKNIPLFFTDATTTSSLPANQAYRPGLTILNTIDCWIGGKGEPIPFYYHMHIFIAFLLLGLFIYFLSLKIYTVSFTHWLNPYLALLTAAIFLLHTANAETINYIISRSDSQSTLFIVISLCVFAYYPTLRKYQLYVLFMLIGFAIKEPAIMLGPLAFLYLYLFENNNSLKNITKPKTWISTFIQVLPPFIVAVLFYFLYQKMTPATWTPGGSNRWHYLLTQTFVMVHYVKNYFLPFDLSADTDWGLITKWYDDRVLIGLTFITATLVIAYRASLQLKNRPITYGILWFYLALLPSSSLIPFSEVLNDHRVFFPYIGLTMAVVWALFLLYLKYETSISKNKLSQVGIVSILALFLIAHTYGVRQRCKVWSKGELLWYDVTIKSPKNGRGLMNYGNSLMARADYKGAEDYFNRAKAEWPYYSYIYLNLGVLQNAQNKPVEAEANFKYAMQLNGGNPNAYYYYAEMLKTNGRISEARAEVEKGLRLSPKHPSLTALYAELTTNPIYTSNAKNKVELLEALCKQTPTAENYLNLSLEYYFQARYLDCIKAAEESLKLKPNYDLAYNNICSAYNMLQQFDKAIEAGEKAVAANPSNQLAKNNLAASYDGKKKTENK